MAAQPFKGRILISDLDGTLLDSNRLISRENIDAIRRFREGGGIFTLATGRMFKGVEPYIPQLDLDMPAVIFNGAAIYDFYEKKILWQQCLPSIVESVAKSLIDNFPGIGMEVLQGDKLFVVRSNIEVEKHVNREGFVPYPGPLLEELPKPWFKILLAWDPKELPKAEKLLEQLKRQYSDAFRYVYSEPQFLEILSTGVSKGTTLLKLLSMYGYDEGQVIAVGDNMNDLEFIQTAGTGIAVANAHADLKMAADFICRDNDSSPLAHVVEMIEKGLLD